MKLAELLSMNGGLEVPHSKASQALPLEISSMPHSALRGHGVFEHWRADAPGRYPKSKTPFAVSSIPKRSRWKAGQLSSAIFLPVKATSLQPIQPLLETESNRGRGANKALPEKLTRLGVWLMVILLALAAIASGFRMQQVQNNRETLRLARQLKASERSRRQAELAARMEHTKFVIHIAQEQQQQPPDLRWVTNARPRFRLTTKS